MYYHNVQALIFLGEIQFKSKSKETKRKTDC